MKLAKYIIALFIIILFSCQTKRQVNVNNNMENNNIIDVKGKDIFIVKVNENGTYVTNSSLFSKKMYIQYRKWGGVDFSQKIRGLLLKNKTDSMILKCNCKELNNFYFKNIKFKKGYYIVKMNKEFQITGDKIRNLSKLNNILFKNTNKYSLEEVSSINSVYFKDLKFKLIDFSDTLNVKLIPISKEDFYK